jgi:uncharacterized protein YutE (UPF0331/DUF86 family)
VARQPHRVVRTAEAKLANMRRYLTELGALYATAKPGFKGQDEKWRAVERMIELVVEAGLNVAGLFITLHGATPPGTYKDTFRALAPLDIVDTDLAERLAEHVGLRNLFIHSYETVDAARVYKDTAAILKDFEEFRGRVTAALATWKTDDGRGLFSSDAT